MTSPTEHPGVNEWRQARAIALLPGMVTIVVPAIIVAAGDDREIAWGLDGAAGALLLTLAALLIAAGFAFWLWTVRLFASVGEGTLAPWDAPRHLVVEGPYRYVRNPMITGVLLVLLGEAAILGEGLLIWSGLFLVLNYAVFVVYEEPGLERRFGDQYREYKENVPRWVPRRTPWVRA